ncbi:bifunctional diaminohydroxyphosphoribosylaminopyrimidine deaminase/5-amino-6-(5-phosphoribosylamino)uracil reductase RibD [uncultured Flavobacterium sp.]|uniref:bifunctional diaminohydroxyphosphoribosylaminopyrimidine deaminase/5-amino-6-(5-phosphoribosylamino)uracil reductase RibD n=1 Tax=uncultured Flavobacterium sp. TaxID=165435 RepID=UPI0030C86232
MKTHEKYINRCIELAKNGLGTTYPNPLVGSVIVYEDKIIGEGWHRKAGEPHAEVNAINAVEDKSLLTKSTIYVSLEPCSHFGKTPPCADLIVTHKIPNVVIGTIDPNEKVAGNGIKKLMEAGANVTVGVLEEECYELNKRFFTFHNKKRPYIILKWAETADGFIAPSTKKEQKPVWITNAYSRQLVHKWRTEEQAILVGTQTVLDDNPSLNARDFFGNNPIRIVLDKSGKIDANFHVKDNSIKTLILTESKAFQSTKNCIYETCQFDENLVENTLAILVKHQIQSVIIEGGSKTIQSFIDKNIWDEARIFKGKNTFENGTKAPVIKRKIVESKTNLDDKLVTLKNYD